MVKVNPSFIKILDKKLKDIDNSKLPPNDKLGDIGEAFVKDGIKYYLWEKGFQVNISGNRTFTIYGFNKETKKRSKGGIDFILKVRYSKTYHFYIEVKNWRKYKYITSSTFKTEILNRFTKNANQPGCIWIVVMNKSNIPLINHGCNQNNILIIPLDKYITSININISSLNNIMEYFLDDFSKRFIKITNRNPHSFKSKSTSTQDKIKEDIRLGKPYDLIAETYGKSEEYIQKIKSEMKSQGEDLIDRRSGEWDVIQFITD